MTINVFTLLPESSMWHGDHHYTKAADGVAAPDSRAEEPWPRAEHHDCSPPQAAPGLGAGPTESADSGTAVCTSWRWAVPSRFSSKAKTCKCFSQKKLCRRLFLFIYFFRLALQCIVLIYFWIGITLFSETERLISCYCQN